MKFSFEKIMKHIECLTIYVGVFTLVLSLFGIDCIYLTGLASALFIVYISYAIYLWKQRPKFDWHLINGNFLKKVVAFVLLVPSGITSGFLIYNKCSKIAYSPKNLVYDENLYTYDGSETDTLGIAKCELFTDSVFLNSHNLELSDSIIIQKNKLPKNIISKQEDPSIFWTVYYHFIDPGNQHMTTSQSGRGWSALIAILGVFLLNGLLVSSIIGWIDIRKEKWLKGEIKYRGFLHKYKHYVIIGGNDMTFGIVRQIMPNNDMPNNDMPYILIQTTRDVEEFRRELFSMLTEQQQQHIIIYYGSRTSETELMELCLQQAIEVYILGEQTRTDDLEPYHDTVNMQCFDLINQLLQGGNSFKEPIRCYVMFEYQTSFAAFQSSSQSRIIKTPDGKDLLSFIPFSPYENWAQTVLVNGNITIPDKTNIPITYNNIDGDGISYDSDKTAHIIIVGMSKMGTAMAIETAHLAHFPNFVRDNSKRTKITFIDKNAREESDFFMGRFPDLFKLCKWTDVDGKVHNWYAPTCNEYQYFEKNFLDIEWEFRSGGVESKENREYIESCFNEKNTEIVTIAVCLPQPHQSLAAALYLPKVAIHKANDIWVYQPQSGELLIDINKGAKDAKHIWEKTTYRKLKPFGMLSLGFDAKLLENDAIKYCSNFYKAKDALVNKFRQKSDNENTCYWNHWDRKNVEEAVLSEIDLSLGKLWAIWSNIYQVNTIEFKMRSLGLDFSKLDDTNIKELFAKVEHNRWNVEKLLMGYRPLEDHTLNKEEIEIVREYLKVNNEELAKIQEGINEKDIYYDWREESFKVKKVKGFYKDGPMKVHPNICPFECLPMDDKNYDICFTLAMPFLREKMKKS